MNIPDGKEILCSYKSFLHITIPMFSLKYLLLFATYPEVSKACHSVTVQRDLIPYLTGSET